MITMPATLDTQRLHLRAPVAADAAAVFSYAGDPRVTRYMVWPTADDLDDVDDFLDDVAWGWSQGDDYTYVVIERASDRLVGAASCQFSDEGAELGYILRRDCWGRGLATEAVSAVMAEICALDDIHRIWATCDTENQSSAAVLVRLGMAYEGCLRRRSRRPNLEGAEGPRDDALYAWVR